MLARSVASHWKDGNPEVPKTPTNVSTAKAVATGQVTARRNVANAVMTVVMTAVAVASVAAPAATPVEALVAAPVVAAPVEAPAAVPANTQPAKRKFNTKTQIPLKKWSLRPMKTLRSFST